MGNSIEGDNIMGKDTYMSEVKDDFLNFHEKITRFAVFLQEASSKKEPEKTEKHLAVSALTKMHSDLVCIHRAILVLCEGGWAFIASNLLRTMYDFLLSGAVIVNAVESSYMGFKYFTLSYKQRLSENNVTQGERKIIRKEVDLTLAQLHDQIRRNAKEWFYKGKLYTYWYSPEFLRPRDIIAAYCPAEIQWLYDKFSGSVHGGFLGLGLLRDDPDKMDINPRIDRRAPILTLSNSYRIMLEFARFRNIFEGLALNKDVEELHEEFLGFKDYVDSMQPIRTGS
jgi:hypothetical protein